MPPLTLGWVLSRICDGDATLAVPGRVSGQENPGDESAGCARRAANEEAGRARSSQSGNEEPVLEFRQRQLDRAGACIREEDDPGGRLPLGSRSRRVHWIFAYGSSAVNAVAPLPISSYTTCWDTTRPAPHLCDNRACGPRAADDRRQRSTGPRQRKHHARHLQPRHEPPRRRGCTGRGQRRCSKELLIAHVGRCWQTADHQHRRESHFVGRIWPRTAVSSSGRQRRRG